MKKSILVLTVILAAVVLALISAKPVISANREVPSVGTVEYKIVTDLGKRSTISKMDKALDSFGNQQKNKAIIEIDLKGLGDEGWELVYFERESGYAIFKRPAAEKK